MPQRRGALLRGALACLALRLLCLLGQRPLRIAQGHPLAQSAPLSAFPMNRGHKQGCRALCRPKQMRAEIEMHQCVASMSRHNQAAWKGLAAADLLQQLMRCSHRRVSFDMSYPESAFPKRALKSAK